MNPRNKTIIKSLVLLILPALIVLAVTNRYEIRVNVSESLDGKIYLLDKWDKVAKRGKKMSFRADHNGYYKGEFVKIVAGIPGDHVFHHAGTVNISFLQDSDEELVRINSDEPSRVALHYIGKIKEKGQNGQDLKPGPQGVIPEGQYFMAGSHKDSFDSRYKNIGYVKDSDIIGSIYTIL